LVDGGGGFAPAGIGIFNEPRGIAPLLEGFSGTGFGDVNRLITRSASSSTTAVAPIPTLKFTAPLGIQSATATGLAPTQEGENYQDDHDYADDAQATTVVTRIACMPSRRISVPAACQQKYQKNDNDQDHVSFPLLRRKPLGIITYSR
jgi:hypothetical protein